MCTAPLIFFLPAPDNLAGGPDSEGVETIVCKTKEHVHYQQIYTNVYIRGRVAFASTDAKHYVFCVNGTKNACSIKPK